MAFVGTNSHDKLYKAVTGKARTVSKHTAFFIFFSSVMKYITKICHVKTIKQLEEHLSFVAPLFFKAILNIVVSFLLFISL